MPTTDAQALAEQLLLGRYRVLETRGEGGFGTVYVCWDPRLMRRVAIKSIRLKPQSAIGHDGTKVRCYLSTLLATFIILAVQLGCARMENEGVWTSLPQGELACVLGSTILVALLILAFGSSAHLESDLERTDAPAPNVP